MIAQTSLSPYMHSPVSSYQVGLCLSFKRGLFFLKFLVVLLRAEALIMDSLQQRFIIFAAFMMKPLTDTLFRP